MLKAALSCDGMLCHVMPCDLNFCQFMPSEAMWCHVMLGHLMQFRVMPCDAMLHSKRNTSVLQRPVDNLACQLDSPIKS